MSCAFDLEHYRVLLDSAKDGGYTFAFFDHDPQPGDVFLRHDVDLSLDAALVLAELEAEEGAGATYFLMTRSVFYNLASAPGEAAVERLRALGTGSRCMRCGHAPSWTTASTRSSLGTTPIRRT